MKIHLQTPVATHYQAVLAGFNKDLFQALAPPFPRLKILRFDGSAPGDVVEIELSAGPFRRKWTSLITEQHTTETAAWFVDEGQILPAPLTFWRHKHLITHHGSHSVIHDQIEFNTGSKLLDLLVYPALYVQFALRGPIYRRIFGAVTR